MIVFLLIIIACVMLFGKEQTKAGIGLIIGAFIVLGIFGSLLNSCGLL